jgi:hypothetical protein
LTISIGFGLGKPPRKRGGTAPSPVIYRTATRNLGAGFAAETGVITVAADGAQTYNATYTNLSNRTIDTAAIAFQGWSLTTSGYAVTGNSVDISGTIEYPVGTVIANIPTTTVPSASEAQSVDITIPGGIPANGSFKVNLTSNVLTIGQKYVLRLGIAGVLTKAKKSELNRLALFAVGDSIMTNNGGAVYNASNTRCPAYQVSIGGTTAATYAASSGANFVRQIALAQMLGATHIISNFGTNDYGAAASKATLAGYLNTFKSMSNAGGMRFIQATMLPRTLKIANISVTSATYAGNVMSVTVPDASLFAVGKSYTFAGATQTEYNGGFILQSKAGNVLSFPMAVTANTTATGTITATASYFNGTVEFQTPYSPKYAAGAGSDRGLINADIRANLVSDGYMEWADIFETTRDSGRWAIGGELPLLPDMQNCTVQTGSPLSTTRFQTNYSRGNSTISGGLVQFTSGANIGLKRNGNGNTNGDVTVASAFAAIPTVGDTFQAIPGAAWSSDDGTHPRTAVGAYGGQTILNGAVIDWITANL